VVQANVLAPVEGDVVGRVLDAPEREHRAAVGDVHGRVGWSFTHHLPAEAVHEKRAGRFEVRDGQADVIEPQRQGV